MEPFVILLVLAAAIMHAVWNSILKVGADRLMTMAVVIGVGGVLSVTLLIGGPPPAPESWFYIGLSAAIHCAYFFFLIQAYEVGDLSHAYPLARGSAPLMVAAGGAWFADEFLSPLEIFAVVVISAGIISLMLTGNGGSHRTNWRTLAYPLATGMMIAAYTVTDGLGVRLSGNPASYIGWLFVLSALPIVAFAIHRRRRAVFDFLKLYGKRAIAGGVLAFCAYALAIWALSLGVMVHVSALRETSVVIAALIGTLLLGEPYGLRRVLSASTVAGGVILLLMAA